MSVTMPCNAPGEESKPTGSSKTACCPHCAGTIFDVWVSSPTRIDCETGEVIPDPHSNTTEIWCIQCQAYLGPDEAPEVWAKKDQIAGEL